MPRVLLATDLSEGSLHAARAVRHVAPEDADVVVVHVVPYPTFVGQLPYEDRALVEQAVATNLSAAEPSIRAWAESAGFPGAPIRILRGDVARSLASEAAAMDAPLVALGSHGAGRIERLLLGSVTRGTLRRIEGRELLVARGAGAWPPRSILVATDFGEAAALATRRAAALAKRHRASLAVVHVVDPAGWQIGYDPRLPPVPAGAPVTSAVQRALDAFAAQHAPGATTRLLHGRPAFEIAEAARGADLVVVGSHGAGAVERALLGSVAESVVERAPVSVLVVGERAA